MSNKLNAEADTYTTHEMNIHALSRSWAQIPAIKWLQTYTLDCITTRISTNYC